MITKRHVYRDGRILVLDDGVWRNEFVPTPDPEPVDELNLEEFGEEE